MHGKKLPSIKKNHNMATIIIQFSRVSYAHIHHIYIFSRTMARDLLQTSFSNNIEKRPNKSINCYLFN